MVRWGIAQGDAQRLVTERCSCCPARDDAVLNAVCMATPYRGLVDIADLTVSVVINDLDSSSWFGQITSVGPRDVFGSGLLDVELLEGPRDGWPAMTRVDATGALRGITAFACDVTLDSRGDAARQGTA